MFYVDGNQSCIMAVTTVTWCHCSNWAHCTTTIISSTWNSRSTKIRLLIPILDNSTTFGLWWFTRMAVLLRLLLYVLYKNRYFFRSSGVNVTKVEHGKYRSSKINQHICSQPSANDIYCVFMCRCFCRWKRCSCRLFSQQWCGTGNAFASWTGRRIYSSAAYWPSP